MRTLPKGRLLLGLAILAVSLLLLVWGLWPAPAEQRTVPVFPEDMQLPTPQSGLVPPRLAADLTFPGGWGGPTLSASDAWLWRAG